VPNLFEVEICAPIKKTKKGKLGKGSKDNTKKMGRGGRGRKRGTGENGFSSGRGKVKKRKID